MTSKLIKVGMVAVVAGGLLTGCGVTGPDGGPSQRTAVLGGTGAAIGAAIGAQRGVGGAVAGAIIGGAAGLVVGALIDEIEREQMRQASIVAVRSGSVQARTFRNSRGETVRVRAQPVRTFRNERNQNCREIRRVVERQGGQAQDVGNQTACEVRAGSGQYAEPA